MINKKKIILSIITSIFLILTVSTIINTYKQNEYFELKQTQSFQTIQNIIDGKIIFFRKHLKSRTQEILSDDTFKKAVINNDFKTIQKHLDRSFAQLKKENHYTKTLHLIAKNNHSWYRAHKPEKRGDDLTDFRPIVVYVNKHKRTKYGFETGKYAMAYRIDLPIFYDGVYYGLLEYGIDSDLFTSDLTIVSNHIQSAVLLNKKNTNKRVLKSKNVRKNSLENTENYTLYDDDFFFEGVEIDTLLKGLDIEKNGRFYKPYIYDLLNFNAEVTGGIVIAKEITADKKRYESMISLSIFNQLLLITIIFFIVYYAFKYYDKKIQKLTEQEKYNEKLIHHQAKMASMGEMIGNIAHQWRQPLSTISTIASGINVQKEYGIYDDNTLTNSMDLVIKQTEYMSQTIEDFRDFFKSDKEKTTFNLHDVIEQNISLIKPSLKSNNIEILYDTKNNIDIYGYHNELTQAILNILSNGKDQLQKLPSETPRRIKITTHEDKENIYIAILDNGGGIEQNIIHKIFDPYFTTKHQSQGTGIGLYMTHEIITRHFGGTITPSNIDLEIEDTTYKCAIFTIVLPKD